MNNLKLYVYIQLNKYKTMKRERQKNILHYFNAKIKYLELIKFIYFEEKKFYKRKKIYNSIYLQ